MRHPMVAVLAGLTLTLGACGSPPAQPASGPPPPSVRPVPSSAAPATAPPPVSTPASAPASAPAATYAFPVVGTVTYAHTHHDYPATDIITRCGNKVVAATSGTILAVTRKDTWTASVNDGATRGGLTVSLLGDDGVRYYGSHLSVIGAKIVPGVRVSTGQQLGEIGATGDASGCHLHFGISPPCAKVGDWWIQRGVLYPWPYLDGWRAGRPTSAVAAVAAWKAKHGCPGKPLVDP